MSTNEIKVSMFSLVQNDLDAAIEFYKKLGFPLTFQVPGKWAEFDIKGIKLFLYRVEEALPERYTGLALEVPDLQAFFDEYKDKGIEFINPPQQVDYAVVSSIKDPGNNIIGLVQPTPEKVRSMMNQDDCCQDKCGCD